MNVLQEFSEWLATYSSLSGYVLTRGMWTETEATANTRFIMLRNAGGRGNDTGVRFPQVQLLVVGRRNERQYSGGILEVENFASGIIDHAIENFRFECIVNIRPMAEMIGPGFTEHDRPWYQLDFELII